MTTRSTIAATIIATVSCLAFFGNVGAAQIWTDGNGDGLPDVGPITVAPSTSVTVGLWIDAESLNWTNYLAYVEWTPGCIQYESATYVITGGNNFPIDDSSHPN